MNEKDLKNLEELRQAFINGAAQPDVDQQLIEHLMRTGLTEEEAIDWVEKGIYSDDDFSDELEGLLEGVQAPTFTSN